MVLISLEIFFRVFSSSNFAFNRFSYNPYYTGEYQNVHHLKDLLNRSTLKYRPFKYFSNYRLNSKGLRTKEYSEFKALGTTRIVILGDSFAYASGGIPNEKLWINQVEKKLRLKSKRNIELINMGVPGVGPRFELRLWQLEGIKLKPDLVILAFFIGNDILEINRKSLEGKQVFGLLMDKSVLFRIIHNLIIYKKHGHKFKFLISERPDSKRKKKKRPYDPNRPSMSKERFMEIESSRLAICEKSKLRKFNKLFEIVKKIILEIHRGVIQTGSDFLLVLIPDEFQVNDPLFSRIVEFKGGSRNDYDIDRPQRMLANFCMSKNIKYVDLLPTFIKEWRHDSLYKLRNTHWNIKGNTLAAELISQRILEEWDLFSHEKN